MPPDEVVVPESDVTRPTAATATSDAGQPAGTGAVSAAGTAGAIGAAGAAGAVSAAGVTYSRRAADARGPTEVADLLVIDLLGGIGDLVMLLPSLRALARSHPGAAVRVLTHAPGATLLDPDPDVAEVRTAPKGGERAAVVAELERQPADLVVSTTRYDGIAEEIERRVARSVTDLWRRPPPDEPVARRYHRILAAEGLVRAPYAPPRLHLTADERSAGRRLLADLVDGAAAGRLNGRTAGSPDVRLPTAPVVLVPDAGMAVKRWPHQDKLVAALTRRGVPVL